eukprot:gene341-369_t
MKSTKEATIYKRISHRRNFWLIHDTFIAWKNGFYICFLQRLKEQNALLRTYPLDVSTTSTPGKVLKSKKLPSSSASRREKKKKDINPLVAATAMSSRRNKESSKQGAQFIPHSSKEQRDDIHQNKDESKSALPPPFPPLLQSLTTHPPQPVSDEADLRSSFTIIDSKTPFELLSIKYFYLWANYTKEIRRLKMLGKSLTRSHRRRVTRHIFTIMQNKLISSQWKNYQLIVKSNKQQQQRIESVSKQGEDCPTKLQELRQAMSNQYYTVESLKVKLATIEDHLHLTFLHSSDNEQSLKLLQHEKTTLLHRNEDLRQEILISKASFEEEKLRIQGGEKRKEGTTVEDEEADLQRMITKLRSKNQRVSESSPTLQLPRSFTDLERYLQILIDQIQSLPTAPNSPSSNALVSSEVSAIMYNQQYLQSLSQHVHITYEKEVEQRRRQNYELAEEVEVMRKKISAIETDIALIQSQYQQQSDQKQQLLASRMSLQQLLSTSQTLLQKNAQQLIAELRQFEDEMEKLLEEKKELSATIQQLLAKEKELQLAIQQMKQDRQRESLKQISTSVSKESIEREVDTMILQKSLIDPAVLLERAKEFTSPSPFATVPLPGSSLSKFQS